MKLYMIRRERGDSIIAQAENEPEVLEIAGIDRDAEHVTVRELKHFACDVTLGEDCPLQLTVRNWEESEQELLHDYPALAEAASAKQQLEEAAAAERVRLLISSEQSHNGSA